MRINEITSSNEDRRTLIKYYKKANDILKREGFSAGVDRFTEFAKLIFYKIILEKDHNVIGKNWLNLDTQASNIVQIVNNDLKKLSRHYNHLVSETRVQSRLNLQELLNILNNVNFSLTETDYKGDAFEYFIHSYTKGAKNDLGQYFTPRHIVKLCVTLAELEKRDTIYDPFCGTGGMLIEAFKYLREFCNEDELADLKNKHIHGNEITEASGIAKMNMICAGDGHNNINKRDSYKNRINSQFDKVITNIPFSQHTETHNAYGCPISTQKNGDLVGVLHCLYSMKREAKACSVIIVPIGLLYKDETKFIREYIYNNYTLDTVVELHEHVFQPYTMQHTAILKVRNKIEMEVNQTTPFFKYYRIENDGFSKNAYRIAIKDNDLEKVVSKEGYQKIYMTNEWKGHGGGYEFKQLSFSRYEENVETISLGDFCEVLRGTNASPNKNPELFLQSSEKDTLPFYMAEDLSRNHITFCLDSSRQYVKKRVVKERNLKVVGDKVVLLVTSGQSSLKNHRALTAGKSVISSTVTGIKIKDPIVSPEYLFAFFLDFDFKNITYDYGYPGTTNELLKRIHIPINDDRLKRKSQLITKVQQREIDYNLILQRYQALS